MIAALYVARGGCYFGLPDVDRSRPACEMTTTTGRRTNGKRVEMQCKGERAATPPAFRDALLSLARLARPAAE